MTVPEQEKPRVIVRRLKKAAPPSQEHLQEGRQLPQEQLQEEQQLSQEQPLREQAISGLSRQDLDMLQRLADYAERVNLAEYVRLTQTPARLLSLNFLGGVARGFGMAIGFTLLGALAIYMLNRLNVLNLPLIGDLIAQILEYVELSRGMRI